MRAASTSFFIFADINELLEGGNRKAYRQFIE